MSGIRLAELCNLRIQDIKYDNSCLRIVGKGDKERLVAVSKQLLDILHSYLAQQYTTKINLIDKDSKVFPKDRRGIERIIEIAAERAGITDKHITPHTLRHTYASRAYKKGMNLANLRDQLGHENIATTNIYTHTDIEERKSNLPEGI
jgi:integrase/recombinase XerC